MTKIESGITVSVVMHTYGHEKFIEEAVRGVLIQVCDFNIELIIANDKSPDETDSIVKKIIETHPKGSRIKYYRHEINLGMMPNFIWSLEQAKGKYIALCESDDYWTDPLKLQKQVDFLEKNKEYGMVHTNFDTFYQNENYFLKNTHTVYNINLKDDCTLDYWNLFGKAMATIKTLTVCFRKDLMKEWLSVTPENNWLIGDFPMYFYITLHSKVGYINESTSVYRTVPVGSASNVGNDYKKKLFIRKTYVDIRLFFFTTYKLDEMKFKKALIRDLNSLLDYCIITGNESILNEYLEIFSNLKWQKNVNNLSEIYSKSNSSTKKYLLQKVTKMRLLISTYLIKFLNRKFLITTVHRKLKYRNV